MKQRVDQLFKDKLTLVMLVLGLLTIVAAAGVVTLQRGRTEESPYLNLEGDPDHLVDGAGEDAQKEAGTSNADRVQDSRKEKEDSLAKADGSAKTEGKSAKTDSGAKSGAKTAADSGSGRVSTAKEDAVKRQDERTYGYGGDGIEAEAAPAGAGSDAASGLVLDFAQTQSMAWPVEGNVLLDYSMDSTIYFPTLEQYKCNPGLVIQSDVSQPVAAPANARVTEAGVDEEIGNYLVLDLGDDYALTCGQLKEVQAVEGEYLEKGQVLGYVAEPTKYYTLEGPNVFLELKKEGKPVDPLDHLE